jgi:hypothetical protein
MSSLLSRFSVLLAGWALLLPACGGGSDEGPEGDAGSIPKAPSNLEVTSVSGGAHLTWKDNSDNEKHFSIMKDLEIIKELTFNTTQYHDADVESGKTYEYMVHAGNDAGQSVSNTVKFEAP